MAELPAYLHGLEAVSETLPWSKNDDGMSLRIHPDRGYINLRGPAGDAGFVAQVDAITGAKLPLASNTFSQGEPRIFWLGPDEWLIETSREHAAPLLRQLHEATNSWHRSVQDVSGGHTCFSIQGAGVRELLAKGCTLDLHPGQFKAGQCAQTGLARTGMLISRTEDPQLFEFIIRRSFADYALRWLCQSGAEFDIHLRSS